MKIVLIIITIIQVFSLLFAGYEITDKGVEFTYSDPSAKTVYIGGSFNNWSQDANELKKGDDGVFRTVIELKPGKYQYKFVVDGNWKEDTDNPEKIDDGYGGINSIVEVLPVGQKVQSESNKPKTSEGKAVFTYFDPDAREVSLTGDFTDWNPTGIEMTKQSDGNWFAKIELKPGEYEYKFVVDGNWTTDPMNPTVRGDFGNSVIKIASDGTAIYPDGAKKLSNSTASSRILFSGLFVTNMLTFRDRDLPGGYYGDNRWKLYRPLAKVDINLRVNVAEGVAAFGSFDVNTFDAEKIYEAHLHIDSVGISLNTQDFALDGFYNREIFILGDPLGLVGDYKYDEPTFEKPQKFGLGCAGIIFGTTVKRTIFKGTNVNLLAGNVFEDWTLDTDPLDFSNRFGRRPVGFWMRTVARADKPTDFSDYGTDVFAGRISNDFGFISPAIDFRIDRDQLWLPTSEITYSLFDSIYDNHNLHSDWLDLGALETGIGGDLTIVPIHFISLYGEFINWNYRSSIDAGNRENHDNTGDSTLDITLGTQNGYIAGGGLKIELPKNFYVQSSAEIEHYDPMDSNQTYIIPQHNDGSTGRPTLEFQTMSKFDRTKFSGAVGFDRKIVSANIEGFDEKNKDDYNYIGVAPDIKLNLFDKRLMLKSMAIISSGECDSERLKFSGIDLIFNTKFYLTKKFAVEGDILYKKIKQDYVSGVEITDSTAIVDKSILAPYFAFLYEPKNGISFEISTGVRPYNLRGQYTGRTEWIYDTMSDNGISYIDALERMSLFQGINLFASVRF